MKNKTLKYSLSVFLLFIANIGLFAQAETPTSSVPTIWIWVLNNIIFLIGMATIVGAIFAIYRFAIVLLELDRLRTMRELGIEQPKAVSKVAKESLWQRLNKKAWKLTPIEKERDILLDHNYDGIRELDNHLPPWWVAMFYGCIVIGIAYYSYYHVFDYGLSSAEEYQQEIAQGELAVQRYLAMQPSSVNASNVAVLTDADALAKGKETFLKRCVACHGAFGEGTIGPNLTDEYWIHGGDIKDLFTTIKYGVVSKGMQAWQDQLSPEEIQMVSSYILSLQGTNPPNGKKAEGEKMK